MKKIITLFASVLFVFDTVSAQQPVHASVDAAPATNNSNPPPTVQTPWQVLFSYDITAAGAGIGNAGVVMVGPNFWIARWNSDTFSVISPTGSLLSQFRIIGIPGTRSLTTDGTNVYAGCNTAGIYKIDPITQTLITVINTPSVPNVRYCTYDPTANSGAGGFWVGTWATNFTLVSMTGAVLGSIPASSHLLTNTYGLAYDGTSPGGPYLWAFNQDPSISSPYNANLIQINIATGSQTSVIHDVTSDIGTPSQPAAGVYVSTTPFALYGVLQFPPNYLFSYDIVGVNSGVNEALAAETMVSVWPNPATQTVNIRVNRTNNDQMQIQLVNALGQVVSSSTNVGLNNIYNLENLAAGVYSVLVTNNGVVYTTKLVKE
ncbi:MAG: T9SS type A sorting domain-containing protein [Bacteroidia bacterium]